MATDSDRGFAEPYRALRKLWTGTTEERLCSHVELIQKATPSNTEVCAECVELGDDSLHLHICLICGSNGCCGLAKDHHMRNHYKETGHPLIQSFQPLEDRIWCYEDEAVLEAWLEERDVPDAWELSPRLADLIKNAADTIDGKGEIVLRTR